jgi:hypothetical protein
MFIFFGCSSTICLPALEKCAVQTFSGTRTFILSVSHGCRLRISVDNDRGRHEKVVMGNLLSYLVLLAWPAVAAVLFSRLAYREAAIWTLVAGYLLLPPVVGIKIPMVPLFGQEPSRHAMCRSRRVDAAQYSDALDPA